MVRANLDAQDTDKPAAHATRRRLVLLIQLLLTVALLYFSIRGLDLESALRRIWRMPLTAIGLCCLISASQMVLLAWRWHVLLGFFRCEASLWLLLRGVLAERLVNQLVPSTVGGDSARLLTAAADGVPRGPAFLSILFDRVSGLLGVIFSAGSWRRSP